MKDKDRLNILQRLKSCADGCGEYAGLVPEGHQIDIRLRRISGEARDLFLDLAGVMPHSVSMVELNNGRPSQRITDGLKAQSHNWKGVR
jgi:hypothetical protein